MPARLPRVSLSIVPRVEALAGYCLSPFLAQAVSVQCGVIRCRVSARDAVHARDQGAALAFCAGLLHANPPSAPGRFQPQPLVRYALPAHFLPFMAALPVAPRWSQSCEPRHIRDRVVL